MTKTARARYTLEFKQEAVRLVEGGQCRADGDQPVAGRIGAREDGARHSGKSDGVLRKGIDLKYALIHRHHSIWPISVQCRVLGVSMAGYNEHFVRLASAVQCRHLSDDAYAAGHPILN